MYHADDASGRDKVASIQMMVSSPSASAVVVRKTAAVPVVELGEGVEEGVVGRGGGGVELRIVRC